MTEIDFHSPALNSTGDLEKHLRGRLAGVRLVLEAWLDEDTVAAVQRAVASISRSQQPERVLEVSFPALLVTYLVAEGVNNYRAGSYWPNLTIGGLQQIALGPAFERALRALRLETFEHLADDKALRYVAPILAHGGIPKYSVADFFRLLLPDLRRYGSAEASDLVAVWRARKTAFQTIDVPVKRFLLYGGETAMDFLDRCIELARLPREEALRSGVSELALPGYVVEAYLSQAREGDRVDRVNAGSTVTPRPRITYDPWDQLGPMVVLPPVSVRQNASVWTVNDGSRIRQVPASRVETKSWPLAPTTAWEVELLEGGTVQRTYAFDCLGESPFICFDPATGAYVRDTRPVSLDDVWILFPAGAPGGTTITGVDEFGHPVDVPIVEELPNPTGPWSGFAATHFDLRGLRGIEAARLSPLGAETRAIVRVLRPADRPMLEGDSVQNVASARGSPVYAKVPAVRVPHIPGYALSNWSITLRGSQGVQSQHFGNIGSDAEPQSLDSLFAGLSYGDFDLTIRGPLGSDLRTGLALVPGLSVEIPTGVILPADVGAARVHLRAAPEVTIAGREQGQQVSLPLPVQGDEIRTEVQRRGNSLELRVRVARLQWAIRRADGSASLGSVSVVLDRSEIEKGDAEALLVSTGRPNIELELALEARAVRIQAIPTAIASAREGRWAFDLRPFIDTLRQSDDPALELVLYVAGSAIVVARVTSTAPTTDIRATLDSTESPPSVRVSFVETRRLRGRVVRLWSLQRPWEQPITGAVDDESPGEAVLRSERLRPGRYRAEVAVESGWLVPERPRRGAASSLDLEIGDAGEIGQRRIDSAGASRRTTRLTTGSRPRTSSTSWRATSSSIR